MFRTPAGFERCPGSASQMIEVINYLCAGDKTIGDGDLLADETGPRLRDETTRENESQADSPMHNPFGKRRLVSIKETADRN